MESTVVEEKKERCALVVSGRRRIRSAPITYSQIGNPAINQPDEGLSSFILNGRKMTFDLHKIGINTVHSRRKACEKA